MLAAQNLAVARNYHAIALRPRREEFYRYVADATLSRDRQGVVEYGNLIRPLPDGHGSRP